MSSDALMVSQVTAENIRLQGRVRGFEDLAQRLTAQRDAQEEIVKQQQEEIEQLRERLEKQERLHLTEFFARRGDGDPYEGIEQGGDLRLPDGWSMTGSLEEFEETQEVEYLLSMTSPSGCQTYSRMRIDMGLASDPSFYGYRRKLQKTTVLASALDPSYAQELRDRSTFDYFRPR